MFDPWTRLGAGWVAVALAFAALPPARAAAPAPAAPARPQSEDDLVERALAAIAANDGDAYLALIHTVDEIAAQCPKMPRRQAERERARAEAKVRRGVASCHFRVDWARARRVAVQGGGARKAVPTCKPALQTLDDIVLTYEIDGHRWQVHLDDPFVIEGRGLGFTDAPRCAEVAGE